MKIFYSWQSDIDGKFNRYFIKDCLQGAIKQLEYELAIDDAIRLDHDTKDVAGSPEIANTIFKKIDDSDVFVGDLTFVTQGKDGQCFPNPNVLIELGYALKSLGGGRLLNVMNTSFGEPENNLPFDLAHRRWPVQYRLSEENYASKAEEKKRLVSALHAALVPFTKSPRMPQAQFASNAELVLHREKMRREFDKQLSALNAKKLRTDVIIRDVDRVDGYPDIDEREKGISPWFRSGLFDLYTKGIRVGLRIGKLTACQGGYRYTNYNGGEAGDIKVFLLGEIPYDSIVAVNWDGDEYYDYPHIYCHFSYEEGPYERLVYCEKIDMGHGHVHYSDIAEYKDVAENSKTSGIEFFA